jgi:hypothetical protein
MEKVIINRTVFIEICDDTQTESYNFERDLEYNKFLKVIGKKDSFLVREIFLQLRGRGILNVERLLML